MAFAPDADQRRVVFTRPLARKANAAGSVTGFDWGTLAHDAAPPVHLDTIVWYPDATGEVNSETGVLDAVVVTLSRAVPTIADAGDVRAYATLEAFVAEVLAPLDIGALNALAPAPFVDGSPLRWQRQEFAAGEAP